MLASALQYILIINIEKCDSFYVQRLLSKVWKKTDEESKNNLSSFINETDIINEIIFLSSY